MEVYIRGEKNSFGGQTKIVVDVVAALLVCSAVIEFDGRIQTVYSGCQGRQKGKLQKEPQDTCC